METFYSEDLKCRIRQISKTTARKLFNKGDDIYFQACNIRFDAVWQGPMVAQKDGYSFRGYSFDEICDRYELFNCDAERGKYAHFYVKC